MRSLRDLDAASLRLRDVGNVLLNDSVGDADVRAVVFELVNRAALSDAIEQVNLLVRPTDESYFARATSAVWDDAIPAEDCLFRRSRPLIPG